MDKTKAAKKLRARLGKVTPSALELICEIGPAQREEWFGKPQANGVYSPDDLARKIREILGEKDEHL